MKRCPTCRRTYAEDSALYCLNDATPLVHEPDAASALPKTVLSPRAAPQKTVASGSLKNEKAQPGSDFGASNDDWLDSSPWPTIDLAPVAPPVVPRKRRRGRLIWIVPSFLILLLAGLFIFWQFVIKPSPAYSLALIIDAAQRDDTEAFDELVDTNQIINKMIPQVVRKASERYPGALNDEARERAEALVPELLTSLPVVKKTVREEVKKNAQEFAPSVESLPVFIMSFGIYFGFEIEEDGDTAHVNIKLKERTIKLQMERTNDDRWKIVEVEDETLAQRILDNILTDLPSVEKEVEKEIRRQIKRNNLPKEVEDMVPDELKNKNQ